MKVLMTADTVGGVWTYALELARAVPEADYVIAAIGPPPWTEVRLPNVRVVSAPWKLEWMDDPWDDLARAGEWLLDLEAREKPDVVHLNGYAHGALPFAAPKLIVAHSCVLSWWRAVKGADAPPEWDRYRQAVERGLREADRVIAPSAWMLSALGQHYRFETPSAVIHNGRFAAAVPPASRRETVFAAGRFWDEAKNLKAVAAAAPRLRWPVRLAGDGSPGGRLSANEMAAAYASAGIYLFPALYEPFGLSILEAAQAGCALVIGDIGSLRELWDGAAVFVDPRDVDAIVDAVNTLIADEPRRLALAQRAGERAALFTPSRMAAAYAEVYG